MNPEKLTTRSREAVSAAITAATTAGNPLIEPVHLLAALLDQTDGTAAPLLKAAGVQPNAVAAEATTLVKRLPAASGSNVAPPQSSRPLLQVLAAAGERARELGDEYVSTEHLLVALVAVPSPAAEILTRQGATTEALLAAFSAIRGNRRVTSPDAENTYQSTGEVRHRPHRAGPRRRAGPGHRP